MAAISQKTVGKLIKLWEQGLFARGIWTWGECRAALYEGGFDVRLLAYLLQEFQGNPSVFLPLIYDGTIPAYVLHNPGYGTPVPDDEDREKGQTWLIGMVQVVLSEAEPMRAALPVDELIASLKEDGLDYIRGKVVPAAVKAVDLEPEDQYLLALIRSINPPNIDEVKHHHDESDKAFANGIWGGASSETRNFLIAVLRGLREVATSRGKIPPFKQPGKDGPLIEDFKSIGLFTDDEKNAVMYVWVLLSYSGPHVGIKEEDSARLSRLLAIGMTEWTTLKFIEWEKSGFKPL